MLAVVASLLAGVVAGGLGALLGIGGGAFLVPFLNLVVGLDFKVASAVSLVTVIATSSVTSATPGRLPLVNLRLGMVLEIFTTSGGLLGLMLFARSNDPTLKRAFAVVMAVVALVMLRQLNRTNDMPDTEDLDVGLLGGRYQDPHTGHLVAYRVKRLPVAFGVSLLAGVVSMLGVGGGVLGRTRPQRVVWHADAHRRRDKGAHDCRDRRGADRSATSMQGRIVPTYTAAAVLGVPGGLRAPALPSPPAPRRAG